ncbi:substrate-binding periplasmic protein [Chitinimonas lacunae]|uniref:Substrate-binding periplasmic protein n=1 Tax=Chitinimonas lacunae TaxID=1963018 RepID=A0ABV8MS16_9NEIS
MTLLRHVLLGLAAALACAETPLVRIATGELPPYATELRADRGIALSIVRRAFELAGYRVEYIFLPWSRAQAETRLGKWDASAYWGRTDERERDFWLSDNVVTEQWVFVYRKNIEFNWNSFEDLRPYQIAIIRDYTYTPELRAMLNNSDLRTDPTPDDLAALRKLVIGRVDLAPMERNVACDILSRYFSEGEANRLRAHPRPMTESFTTHLLLPRSRPDSLLLLQAFNGGLKKLYESGEHAQLLKQIRCPNGWSDVITNPK